MNWIDVKDRLPKHKKFAHLCVPIWINLDWKDPELDGGPVPAIRTGSRGKTVHWFAMFNNGRYPDSSEPEYAEIPDEYVTHWLSVEPPNET